MRAEILKQKLQFIPEQNRQVLLEKLVTFNQKEVAEITGFTLKRVANAIKTGKLKGLKPKGGKGAIRFTSENIIDWFSTMKNRF